MPLGQLPLAQLSFADGAAHVLRQLPQPAGVAGQVATGRLERLLHGGASTHAAGGARRTHMPRLLRIGGGPMGTAGLRRPSRRAGARPHTFTHTFARTISHTCGMAALG